MLQAFRNYSFNATYFVTQLPIAAPAGMQVNDVMVMFGAGDSQARGFDTLAGWLLWHDLKPGLGGFRHQVFMRQATISDMGGVTYSWATDHQSMAGMILAISGAQFAVDKSTTNMSTTGNNGYAQSTPFTPSGPNQMVFWLTSISNPSSGLVAPSSMATYANNYNGGGSPAVKAGITVGLSLFAGGLTPNTWCDSAIQVAHSYYGNSFITFKTFFTPGESVNPLIFCEA
jgi:hypothetical protein